MADNQTEGAEAATNDAGGEYIKLKVVGQVSVRCTPHAIM
jgi:hypothetical protein